MKQPCHTGGKRRRGVAPLLGTILLFVFSALASMAQVNPVDGGQPLQTPPETHSDVRLEAVTDRMTRKGAFLFGGRKTAPTIRVRPGSTLHVRYANKMDRSLREPCLVGPCENMTNLHFHGLHVSPAAPQDDVLSMMASPGQSLRYSVVVPKDQPPGLYWYHTHPHGESYQQSLDGMSGAIVVDGLERYFPELKDMREQILILRDRVVAKNDPQSKSLREQLDAQQSCTKAAAPTERLFTVNGQLRPQIDLPPGESQLWRVVNASPDLYANLAVDDGVMKLVALDGMPLSFHDRDAKPRLESRLLLPPGGRAEFIVTGRADGSPRAFRSLCFDTGADGDPNPSMVLADILSRPVSKSRPTDSHRPLRPPVYEPVAASLLATVERRAPDYSVRFGEDKEGFYVNGRKFRPNDPPMTTAMVGAYYHWRIVNTTREVHPFHIHQVHFLVYEEGGRALEHPEWRDTVDIPVGQSVDLVMDFTDPIIRGTSVFHCHLLKHEDKGMMAKILFR